MEFVLKSEKELAEMTAEQRDQYAKDKQKHEQEQLDAKIKEATKPLDEKLKASEATVKQLSEKAEKFEKDAKQLSGKLADLETKSISQDPKAVFIEEVKKAAPKIKEVVKGGSREEVVIKADTLTTSISGNTNAFLDTRIARIGNPIRSLYDAVSKLTLPLGSGGSYKYVDWDEATTVKAANMVAEGAAFPDSTATFIERIISLKKVGDSLVVSEEFGEDEPLAAAELELFLQTNVDAKVDNQLIVGDGTGDNLKGLIASVPAFTPVQSGIVSANLRDLAWKVRTSITQPEGSIFVPSHIVLNSSDFEKFVNEKDSQNRYLFDENSQTIAGLQILIDDNMPANQLVIGDMRFATIVELGGVVVSADYDGLFRQDKKALKVRKRLLFLIRNRDSFGFRKVTDVADALTTLEA